MAEYLIVYSDDTNTDAELVWHAFDIHQVIPEVLHQYPQITSLRIYAFGKHGADREPLVNWEITPPQEKS